MCCWFSVCIHIHTAWESYRLDDNIIVQEEYNIITCSISSGWSDTSVVILRPQNPVQNLFLFLPEVDVLLLLLLVALHSLAQPVTVKIYIYIFFAEGAEKEDNDINCNKKIRLILQ